MPRWSSWAGRSLPPALGIISSFKSTLWTSVTESLDTLRSQYDVVVIEGAGSPAEINLKATEIVNMRVALIRRCSSAAMRRHRPRRSFRLAGRDAATAGRRGAGRRQGLAHKQIPRRRFPAHRWPDLAGGLHREARGGSCPPLPGHPHPRRGLSRSGHYPATFVLSRRAGYRSRAGASHFQLR